MAISNIKASISCDVKKAWDTVTSLNQYEWRSDLSKIEVINEKQFIEYTKDGFATTFTITVSEPCKRWEFDKKNTHSWYTAGMFLETREENKELDKFFSWIDNV